MSKEEIQQLIEELESLRKENLDLKISIGLPSPELINGYPAPAEISDDAIIKGLRNQIQTLQEANQNLNHALKGYEEVGRSLSALLPALEVQMKGQTTEIYHLKQNIDQTENTFAGVVEKLEQQVKQLRHQLLEQREHFHQELLQIQSRPLKAEKPSERTSIDPSGNEENPFTDLSIFEI